jgi:hypothetical protein
MTFLEYQTFVADLCKIQLTDTGSLAIIKDAVNLAIYDQARETPWDELRSYNNTIDLTIPSAGTTGLFIGYDLPADYLAMVQVDFMVSFPTAPYYRWTLQERGKSVFPPLVAGKPTSYFVGNGNNLTPVLADVNVIFLDPWDALQIDSAENYLVVDYYQAPALLDADGDTINTATQDANIINRAQSYVLTWQNKVGQANALMAIHKMRGDKEQTLVS